MNVRSLIGTRQLSVVAATVLAAGLTIVSSAAAAAPASASVANGTLTIRGTGGGDSIQLTAPTASASVFVDFGNGTLPQAFDRNTFATVSVFLNAGDDEFAVVSGSDLTGEKLSVNGGAGNDIIFGSSGNDTLSGGAGDDTISGGDGDDLIFGNGGHDTVNGGRGNDTEVLGAGDDSSVWNPGDGSDVVDGSSGSDTLVFNGSNAGEKINLAANGHNAVLTRDVAAIRMDLAGVESLDLSTIGGVDTVGIGDLTGTDLEYANVDLGTQGGGDGQPDAVTVTGTNKADQVAVSAVDGAVSVSGLRATTTISGSETTDALQVNTLGGNDNVAVDGGVAALIGVTVDLGSGQRPAPKA